jgi:hypothetical protein
MGSWNIWSHWAKTRFEVMPMARRLVSLGHQGEQDFRLRGSLRKIAQVV